jgi:hypothetical protein
VPILFKHGTIFSQTSYLIIIKLLLLLYVAKGSSSLNFHEKRTIPESNFNLARVHLTHTLGTSRDCSEATVCLTFRLMDQIHHKRLQDHTHIQCAGRMSVEQLHDRTLGCPATRIPTHCDLNQIHQHRRGIISTMIPHINPVRHPYSDYRNVNIATPISRE